MTQTVTANKENIIGIEELMKPRTAFLLAQPAIAAKPPVISQLVFHEADGFVEIAARIENCGRGATIFYQKNPSDFFKKLPFNDDGLNGDGQRNDGFYFARIEAEKIGQFYVLAENAEAVALFPEKAGRDMVPVKKE